MKRSSQALLSKSIAESKGKLHAFSRGPRRKVHSLLCTVKRILYVRVVISVIFMQLLTKK